MSADGTDRTLSSAALACRALAPFLFEAAAEVRKYCDPLDADWLELVARDCADTEEWEFDLLQMAERAITRSTKHEGWDALCDEGTGASDARPFRYALEHYEPVANAARQTVASSPEVSDQEFDRLRAVAAAHQGRVAQVVRLRDMWFEAEDTERSV